MPFTTTEEIEQHFAEAINRAGGNDAAVMELRSEKQQVLADFREQAVRQRERNIWVREAFQKFPLARSFPQLITGESEEEVAQAARELHEQLEVVFTEHQTAREMEKVYKRFLEQNQNPNGGGNESAV